MTVKYHISSQYTPHCFLATYHIVSKFTIFLCLECIFTFHSSLPSYKFIKKKKKKNSGTNCGSGLRFWHKVQTENWRFPTLLRNGSTSHLKHILTKLTAHSGYKCDISSQKHQRCVTDNATNLFLLLYVMLMLNEFVFHHKCKPFF
jgi:hypothetical protein